MGRKSISPQTREQLVRDFHESKMTKIKIAQKYQLSRVTVDKLLLYYPYGYWEAIKLPVSPVPVTETVKTVSARTMDVGECALRVVALTLQAMETMLTTHMTEIAPAQLAQFMSAAAPYAIGKVKEKKNADTGKADIFKQFKENLKKQDAKINPVQRN